MTNYSEYINFLIKKLLDQQKTQLAYDLIEHHLGECKSLDDYNVLGKICLSNKLANYSVICAERAYALSKTNEELFASRVNLCKSYYRQNKIDLCILYNTLNLVKKPDDYELVSAQVSYHRANNQWDLVEEITAKIEHFFTEVDDFSDWKDSLESYKFLKEGKIKEGIEKFLGVDKAPSNTQFDILKMKRWNGIPYPGKKLYVYNGGGVGDNFIFIRFFENVKRLGMDPILYSDIERIDVLDIFARHGVEIITQPFEVEKDNPWIKFIQLPAALDLQEKNLWNGPYIKSKNVVKNKLKSKKTKIGIKTSGNPLFAQNEFRKICWDEIVSIFDSLENIELYNFDLDIVHPNSITLSNKIQNWDDTLDFINQMDLVISSCTSVAHAAGSMGKSTIVFVPVLEYFIWTSTYLNNKSPWYGDNFYIVKKENSKSWNSALMQAKEIKNKILYG